MTNKDNKIITILKRRLTKNGWLDLLTIYVILYGFIVYRSASAFLDAHQLNWTISVQSQYNHYTWHTYVMLIQINLIAASWQYRLKILSGLSVLLIIGCSLLLPQLWIAQLIFAILVIGMMINTPKRVPRKKRSNKDPEPIPSEN